MTRGVVESGFYEAVYRLMPKIKQAERPSQFVPRVIEMDDQPAERCFQAQVLFESFSYFRYIRIAGQPGYYLVDEASKSD